MSADDAQALGGSERGEPLSSEEIRRYDLFSTLTKNWLDKNPGAVWLRSYEPGEFICRQGEYGSTAFYVVSGKVRVYIDPAKSVADLKARNQRKGGLMGKLFGKPKKSAAPKNMWRPNLDATKSPEGGSLLDISMGAGEFFGEMTCLSYLPRAANVVAQENVYCLEMLRNILLKIFQNDDQKRWRSEKLKFLAGNPTARFDQPKPPDTAVQKVYRDRALGNELRDCTLFAEVPPEVLKRLVDAADFVSFDPGEPIFREGDLAEDFYLVRRGFVKIGRQSFGDEVVLNYLSKGQYFGEVALLNDRGSSNKRTATCSAIDHVDLIALDRREFDELVVGYPDFRRQLNELIQDRQNKASAPPIKPGLDFKEYVDQGLMQGTRMLLFDLERCTRCDECVRACADSHEGLTRLKREGLRFDKYLVPTSCRSCHDPVCLSECPVGSIGRSPTGAIIIEDWCIGCRACAENCPFGNIEMHLLPVKPGEQIYKQQDPVRLASASFDPPRDFDLTSLPGGLSFEAHGKMLCYADVSGTAGDDELLAYSEDKAYRAAIEKLMERRQTRVKLPVIPTDFKPARAIESVVKAKKANKTDPENAVLFRGVVDRNVIDDYLAASQDATYRSAVEVAQRESNGLIAVMSKAAVCDMCESVDQDPNCVYACPHDAAFRVDAGEFFRAR
ncbi:MAG: cyclic nucleotide-binding domain-containing protein [Anaerolineae bacterium]|nr:cyclic nucleotide-binding domain-containing protein [Phycisphaerae bacterium]